jgi:hypothetical protein
LKKNDIEFVSNTTALIQEAIAVKNNDIRKIWKVSMLLKKEQFSRLMDKIKSCPATDTSSHIIRPICDILMMSGPLLKTQHGI